METMNQIQDNKALPVKTGDWFLTILITAIPLVGLIMLFVWAFGSNTNPNKANWAKASLLWALVCICIMIIFFIVFGAMFLSMNDDYESF